jgi:iron complex outermembrane receptor protein
MNPTHRLSILAMSLAAAWPAAAQQTPAGSAADEDQGQRIVITASKRLEKQREVAGTVTVLSGNDLENAARARPGGCAEADSRRPVQQG